jgi:hypothetical protein
MIKQLAPLLDQHFEQCPLPERLRYCYWSGKWHLAEHRVGAVSTTCLHFSWLSLFPLTGVPDVKRCLLPMSELSFQEQAASLIENCSTFMLKLFV